jgi:HTH-type transcriptional regulator/antitoxin HigA|tara:strand:+ start:253 stop:672 length:420 start_codon:yes stop_codon:yes gene_type:complete
MNAIAIIQPADKLFKEAPFLVRIHHHAEYEDALALVETLLDEENEDNDFLIERLTDVIEEWEDTAPELSTFNESLSALDGVDMLKFLMEQNDLGTADLPEIGSKSYVSKVLNRKRELTRRHIEALSARFRVEPALFFSR